MQVLYALDADQHLSLPNQLQPQYAPAASAQQPCSSWPPQQGSCAPWSSLAAQQRAAQPAAFLLAALPPPVTAQSLGMTWQGTPPPGAVQNVTHQPVARSSPATPGASGRAGTPAWRPNGQPAETASHGAPTAPVVLAQPPCTTAQAQPKPCDSTAAFVAAGLGPAVGAICQVPSAEAWRASLRGAAGPGSSPQRSAALHHAQRDAAAQAGVLRSGSSEELVRALADLTQMVSCARSDWGVGLASADACIPRPLLQQSQPHADAPGGDYLPGPPLQASPPHSDVPAGACFQRPPLQPPQPRVDAPGGACLPGPPLQPSQPQSEAHGSACLPGLHLLQPPQHWADAPARQPQLQIIAQLSQPGRSAAHASAAERSFEGRETGAPHSSTTPSLSHNRSPPSTDVSGHKSPHVSLPSAQQPLMAGGCATSPADRQCAADMQPGLPGASEAMPMQADMHAVYPQQQQRCEHERKRKRASPDGFSKLQQTQGHAGVQADLTPPVKRGRLIGSPSQEERCSGEAPECSQPPFRADCSKGRTPQDHQAGPGLSGGPPPGVGAQSLHATLRCAAFAHCLLAKGLQMPWCRLGASPEQLLFCNCPESCCLA